MKHYDDEVNRGLVIGLIIVLLAVGAFCGLVYRPVRINDEILTGEVD